MVPTAAPNRCFRILGSILCTILLLLSPAAVLADTPVTLEATPQRVTAGSEITLTGTAAPGTWVSLKGLDEDGNIVYFHAVLADGAGDYRQVFKAPAMGAGTLTLVAGSGSNTAEADIAIYVNSGGNNSGSSGGDSSGGNTGSTGAVSGKETIDQAVSGGRKETGVSLPNGGGVSLEGSDITKQNQSGLTVNLEYPQLQIGLKPGSLPLPSSGGKLEVKAEPVEDQNTLDTYYIMTEDGRRIGLGYNITINEIKDGESSPITQLNGEITLTFELSAEDLKGVDPASLKVYKQDSSASMVDLGGSFAGGQLTVSTSHLCQFIITGKVAKERIYGGDRYQTAAAISQKGWEQADTVILACGEDYPDALTGVTLAGLKDAPVLLTAKNSLSTATKQEIARLQAQKIYMIGGTGVLAASVEQELQAAYQVERIQGSDRYQTAIAVGEMIRLEQGQNQNQDQNQNQNQNQPQSQSYSVNTVVLTTGLNFPDALAIAPFAAQEGMPVLYTIPGSLKKETAQALRDWGVQNVIIAGGNAAVSAAVETELKSSLGLSVMRLSGADRGLTSLAIAEYFDNTYTYSQVLVATGQSFADALAGAAYAAKNGYPVLLSGKQSINAEITDYIAGLEIDNVGILGGEGAVGTEVSEEIR